MIIVQVMQMTVMKVVNMIVMLYGGVATAGAMQMRMLVMMVA